MQFMCKNYLQSPNVGYQNQPNAVNLDCNVNPGGHTDECATSKDNLTDMDATEYCGNNTGKLCCRWIKYMKIIQTFRTNIIFLCKNFLQDVNEESALNSPSNDNIKNKAMIGFFNNCKIFLSHISALPGKMSSFSRYQLVAYHNTIIGLTIQMKQNWIVRRE